MGWFTKKDEEEMHEAFTAGSAVEKMETEKYGREECYEYLCQILADQDKHTKGMVLKLYIENFKRLNEMFGYDYCEELLNQILSYLEETIGCVVYRYIGVEFIVVLDQFTEGQALDFCEEILGRFDQVWKVGQTDCLCSIQLGLCSYPGRASTVEELMKCLDLAVARASDCGPNQVIVYDSTLHTQQMRRQAIAMYLSSAIENKEIEVRYRPTYNIERQKFVRAELYLRIFVKGIGMIGAADFLPIAEDSGQIRTLEYFVLDQTGACIADMIARGIEFESISTRISPVMFLQEDFLEEVARVIERYQIPKGKMALEISDTVFTAAYLNVNITMQRLSEMGVEIILNDFGSGYSSISSILEMPIDTVKFERMFIWQLESNPKAGIMVDSLIRMAKNLGLRMIAEGVETNRQLEVLNGAGCAYQQGFYYSPTLGKDALIKIMDTSLEVSQEILAEEKEKMRL